MERQRDPTRMRMRMLVMHKYVQQNLGLLND